MDMNFLMKVTLAGLVTIPTLFSGAEPSSAHEQGRQFTVRNRTSVNIERLYLSPASDRDWGLRDNLLPINRGRSMSYDLHGGCDWDLRAELSNGRAVEYFNIDTCQNNSYAVTTEGLNFRDILGRQEPARRLARQCVSTLSGNVWPDMHCNFQDDFGDNSSMNMFEWRIIPSD